MIIDELESDGKLKVGLLRDRYPDWLESGHLTSVVSEAVASGVETLEYNGGALLKYHIEQNGAFSETEWELMIAAFNRQIHWTCQISICQVLILQPEVFGYDSISIGAFLREVIDGKNVFAKAWGISAFWALGKLYSDYKEEALEYRRQGERHSAKSVQARMRHLAD